MKLLFFWLKAIDNISDFISTFYLRPLESTNEPNNHDKS